MKLIIPVLVGILMLSGAPKAQAATDNAALIAQLLEQVQILQAKLATMKTEESKFAFETRNLGATIYDGYGSYGMDLYVTAGEEDVFIPRTTSDSTKGFTGFVYSVEGDEFNGERDSKVTCPIRKGTLCHIKAGKSSTISVTVWLFPEEQGSHSVSFDKVGFLRGHSGEIRSVKLGHETEEIVVGD